MVFFVILRQLTNCEPVSKFSNPYAKLSSFIKELVGIYEYFLLDLYHGSFNLVTLHNNNVKTYCPRYDCSGACNYSVTLTQKDLSQSVYGYFDLKKKSVPWLLIYEIVPHNMLKLAEERQCTFVVYRFIRKLFMTWNWLTWRQKMVDLLLIYKTRHRKSETVHDMFYVTTYWRRMLRTISPNS